LDKSIFYIDESGSMNCDMVGTYFIIGILSCDDSNVERLKKLYKRFIRLHFNELKKCDKDNKMFHNGKFAELKGSMLTPRLKKRFVHHFCKDNLFELFYIVIENERVSKTLYANKARAFNYVLKLALEYYKDKGLISDKVWILNIDERNVKTNTKYALCEYINTELFLAASSKHHAEVYYHDSENCILVQVADVFANLRYSCIYSSAYREEIEMMRSKRYLKGEFKFPL